MFTDLNAFTSYDPISLLKALYAFFTTGSDADFGGGIKYFFDLIPYYLINFFANWIVFSVVFSLFLILLIFLVASSYTKNKKDLFDMYTEKEKVKVVGSEIEDKQNNKWLQVERHMSSENPSDWKLAILEADIMLAEMLDKFGLSGETIAEKLKMVEKGDFKTIEQAWEGHKIRNAIAHEGSDFLISQREARRVIDLFKQVFEEFKII